MGPIGANDPFELTRQLVDVASEAHRTDAAGTASSSRVVMIVASLFVLVLSTAMPFIKDKRIKPLSVSDTSRVPQLPEVRRMGEEPGLEGLSLPLWQGLFVKAGTPAATVAAYEKALLEALAQPEVTNKLAESGITPAPQPGQALRSFVAPQAKLYRDIVTSSRITLE